MFFYSIRVVCNIACDIEEAECYIIVIGLSRY